MPRNAFGYVPTPALVAPIEFTFEVIGLCGAGRVSGKCAPLSSIAREDEGRRRLTARGDNPWPLASGPAK